MFARKSFLKINNNRLVEYKYNNQRILYVVINIFNKIKGWIKMTGCGFKIILIIILRLYKKNTNFAKSGGNINRRKSFFLNKQENTLKGFFRYKYQA